MIGHCPDGVTQTRSVGDDGKVEGHVQPLTSILVMSADVHRFGPPCAMLTRLSPVTFVALRVSCPKIGVTRKRGTMNGTQSSENFILMDWRSIGSKRKAQKSILPVRWGLLLYICRENKQKL